MLYVGTTKLTKVGLGLNAEGDLARQLHLSPVCEVLGAKESISDVLHVSRFAAGLPNESRWGNGTDGVKPHVYRSLTVNCRHLAFAQDSVGM